MKYSVIAAFVIPAMFLAQAADADITGFGDFSGFMLNQSDAGSPPAVSFNNIQITGGEGEYRSLFYTTPQSIGHFTASFAYRAGDAIRNMGVAFVMQNSPAGPAALGSGFASCGYAGITSSVAVTLEGEFTTPTNPTHSGVYSGGVMGGGSVPTAPVDLSSDHWINATLSYSGSILSETLVDTVTGDTFNTSVLINIPALVGGSTAYVGITAASGDNGRGYAQYLSDLQFSTVPSPTSLAAVALGLSAMGVRRRRRH